MCNNNLFKNISYMSCLENGSFIKYKKMVEGKDFETLD